MDKSFDANRAIFLRDVKVVAKDLLGKTLCIRSTEGEVKEAIISETEAYDGEKDLACHASKGKTARTSVMYEQGEFVMFTCVTVCIGCLILLLEWLGIPRLF